MASNPDLVQYIADQCSRAGVIDTRMMFGDFALYCDGKVVGLICDDRLFLKPADGIDALLRDAVLQPPYDGAKDYFLIDEVDDKDYLSLLVKHIAKTLPEPKPKKRK